MSKYLNILRNNLPAVFSSQEASFFLKGHYNAPLKALSHMEKSGDIIRLRRGFYAFKDGFDPLMGASRIHGPSYISFETALAFYGLIPERVHQIISVVDGRPASFLSNQTRFIYHSQERKLFSLGMSLVTISSQWVPMALPEKAVLDTLAKHQLRAKKYSGEEILDFMVENLRIEFNELMKLSLRKLKKLAPLYRNLAPLKLVESLATKEK